eukprot:jgi/Botrbrau1/13088/Bobra.0187s0047.1
MYLPMWSSGVSIQSLVSPVSDQQLQLRENLHAIPAALRTQRCWFSIVLIRS